MLIPHPIPPGPGPVPTPTPVPVIDAGLSSTPPSPPTGGTTPPTTTYSNFAVHHVHLGDELDSFGNPDWSSYGYDIDGKVTTASSSDVCTLATNANKKNQTDGPGGLDNSFGENIVPLLNAVLANPSASMNTAIANGSYTWIFYASGLSSDPAQTSEGLVGEFFWGAPFAPAGSFPTFTKADNWPLERSLVTSAINANGTLQGSPSSTFAFPKAYVVQGELVSGYPSSVELFIGISGQLLKLNVQHAVITFEHTSATTASRGIISGVIPTQDLVNAMQLIAGGISTSFCSGSTFAQVATSIEQAADIMVDGTNKAGAPCNGISIGVGFDANEIGLPLTTGSFPAASNPCADGG